MKNDATAKRFLEVKGMKKYFTVGSGFLRRGKGQIKAVDNVDLYINEGETLGLVGESGCGKTTLGRCILRAIEPTAGEINVSFIENGKMIDLMSLDEKKMRSIRKYMQMIFQDPYSSLDPRMTVLDIVGEPIAISGLAKGEELVEQVKELMRVVGLEVMHLKRYPHAFSGGQRQRIGIARALSPNPKFIVADEAVSALDVSIQAQILNLLQDIQKDFHLTFLFISHDLSVIEHISDRVAVMYMGKIVEMAETEELFLHPRHPYTEALLSAVPEPDPEHKMKRIILPGEVGNPVNPPSGCYFHPRCSYANQRCREEEPKLEDLSSGHFTACHLAGELKLKGVETLV